MSIVPITLPPGVYKNGTPYDAKGRWSDANLVRWHDGAMRAIGGWERRLDANQVPIPPLVTDTATETVRDCIFYRSNDGQIRMLFGSNTSLYAVDSAGNVLNVTPAGFVGGANEPVARVGYGISTYGSGPYGTERDADDAETLPVLRWTFSMWGENVLCAYETGDIYEYAPDTPQALPVDNAPSNVQAVIVTDERIVMTVANPLADTRMVTWSDREDNSDWTPEVDNYAGFYRLNGNGDLLGAYHVQDEILILSETNAYAARFIGAPFIYSFREVGAGCAPIHHKAVSNTERGLIWLGLRNFWLFDGTLRLLPCDVMDFLASDIDITKVSKIWSTPITTYAEVWWFYQSLAGDEVDSYVSYDYAENFWTVGRLARTAGYDRGATRSPVMVDYEGHLQNHEQGGVIPSGDMTAMTGPLELASGEVNMSVRYVFPDTQSPNEVRYWLEVRQMPTATPTLFGPYDYNNPISTTGVSGRELRMRIQGLTNTWEVGQTTRFDVQPTSVKGFPSR